MVIVDTSVLIDYLNNRVNAQTEWLDRQSDLHRIGITTLILCEVLQGIRGDDLFNETLTVLNQFAIFETGSERLSVASSRNCRALRGLGVTTRNTIDCFIATFCIEEGHWLLHNDSDFDYFEEHLGLRVVHPPAIAAN
jgi:predicted nucleic acid-binding protein